MFICTFIKKMLPFQILLFKKVKKVALESITVYIHKQKKSQIQKEEVMCKCRDSK